jgi:hypothetical protein
MRKVHAGRSILPFRPLDPSLAVFPVHEDRLLASGEMNRFPLLEARWAQLEELFDANKGKSKLTLNDRLNYQGVFARQLPVPQYRLVYTTSGTRLAAAVLDDPEVLINNRLYWVPVASRGEGRYLEAILNSGPFGVAVSKLQGIGLFGARDFHTLPWRMPVAQFDENNTVHQELAALGAEAEGIAAELEIAPAAAFIDARRLVRHALQEQGVQQKMDAKVVEAMPSLAPEAAHEAPAD